MKMSQVCPTCLKDGNTQADEATAPGGERNVVQALEDQKKATEVRATCIRFLLAAQYTPMCLRDLNAA
jgi:hypothetical protein